MGIQLNYFHESLKIIVILIPTREIFYAKSIQFPLTFTE